MARGDALLTSSAAQHSWLATGEWKAFHADAAPEGGLFLMERDLASLLTLEGEPALGPSLFLYRWIEPTISLGYAQREERVLDEEAVRAAAVPVVRRPTGGRAILHVDEWTFAAAVPLDHPRLGGSLRDSLAALSAVVREALAAVGVRADTSAVAPAASAPDAGGSAQACFHRALGHEITVGGRKLAGLAQRRLSRALLTQGTILAGSGHERLADFLAGDRASKRAGRENLARGTATVRELAGVADFGAFTQALRRAWQVAEV